MYAEITDANLSGVVTVPVASLAEAQAIARNSGSWQHPDPEGGAMLLGQPMIAVYKERPTPGTSIIEADWIIETGPRGGVKTLRQGRDY